MISKLTAQLKNIFTGMKLHSKLMLSYFLACTIPLLIVEAIYFSASAGSLEDASKEFTEMYTSQLTSSIDNYIQNYDRIFMSMFVESNVLQQLNKDTSSIIEQIGFSAVMDTLLLRLRTLNPDAKRIIIISANNKVYQSTGSGAFIDPEILKNQAWFQEIIKSGENLVITSTHDQAYNGSNNTDNVFTISRIIYNTSGVYSGVLMFEIDPAQMLKLDNANSLLRNKYGIKLILTALSGGLVYHSDIMNGTATWENIQRQGLNRILAYTEVVSSNNTGILLSEPDLQQLEASIDTMDIPGSSRVIEHIFIKLLSAPGINMENFKLQCLSILFTSMKRMPSVQMVLHEYLGKNILSMEEISRFQSVEQLRNWLVNIVKSIIEYKIMKNVPEKKDLITEIKEYILNNYDKPLTLAELSSHFFINPFYLSQLFKDKAGESYLKFITGIRINKARELLKNSDLRLRDISVKVGYTDPIYFSRLFEKQTGLKPSDFRKKKTEHFDM